MDRDKKGIAALFEAESIVLIGSLGETFFGGGILLRHLRDFGFAGDVYLVNPSRDELNGAKVYSTVEEIPGRIDLAVIMVGSKAVPSVLEQCARKGIHVAVIVSDGFAERDEEGAKLQKEIVEISRRTGLRLIGPNTAGTANLTNGLMTCPFDITSKNPVSGSVAICSQTGFLAPHSLPIEYMAYGISKICDVGNKCDVDESDLLEYLGDDPETKVIAMHLEDITDGRRFMDVAKRVVLKKPVVILKPGRTSAGARASASHTGSMAGEDRIYDSAFRQAGIIRANTFNEFFDFSKVLALQPIPRGNRVAILTFTGGAGVQGVDAASQSGLTLSDLSPITLKKLSDIFPPLAKNPIDIGPLVVMPEKMMSCYPDTMNSLMNDDNVDCIAVISMASSGMSEKDMFGQMFSVPKEGNYTKPIATWLFSSTPSAVLKSTQHFESIGIPVCSEWENVFKALAAAFRYADYKSRHEQ